MDSTKACRLQLVPVVALLLDYRHVTVETDSQNALDYVQREVGYGLANILNNCVAKYYVGL